MSRPSKNDVELKKKIAEKRKIRKPLNTKNVLTADSRPGYHRRIVNDEPGRIDMYQAAGYDIVSTPVQIGDDKAGKDSQIGSNVEMSVGGGKRAFLMEIPMELYEEDKAAAEAQLKANERQLLPKDLEDHYVPEGGDAISMSIG